MGGRGCWEGLGLLLVFFPGAPWDAIQAGGIGAGRLTAGPPPGGAAAWSIRLGCGCAWAGAGRWPRRRLRVAGAADVRSETGMRLPRGCGGYCWEYCWCFCWEYCW